MSEEEYCVGRNAGPMPNQQIHDEQNGKLQTTEFVGRNSPIYKPLVDQQHNTEDEAAEGENPLR